METKENVEKLRAAYKKYKTILYIWQQTDPKDDSDASREETWLAEEEFHELCKTIPSLASLCETEASLMHKINSLDLEVLNLEREFRILRENKTSLIESLVRGESNGEVYGPIREGSRSEKP